MKDGPVIASVAALLGDPARANMLATLMDGRALTVSELAEAAGVTLQTASGHLSKLEAARLLTAEKQGRHRYFRLSGVDVAEVLEGLMNLAQRTGAIRVRTGPKDAALRIARVCYDHLAGERGVAFLERMKQQELLVGDAELVLTDLGRRIFTDFGIDVIGLEACRRPICRYCLDWSERRSHLGGALGAAILLQLIERGWAKRDDGRVLSFTAVGLRSFDAAFAVTSKTALSRKSC